MSAGDARLPARQQRGAGYLVVLFALAAMGLTLAGAGQVWATAAQREREAQLLFVGQQFRLALASYRDATPAGQPDAPLSLQDLVEDRRFPVPRRHLRRLWPDPFTHRADWALVKVGERIHGVHSRVDREPLRTAFEPRDAALVGKNSYAQWVFEAQAAPPGAPITAGTAGAPP